MKRKESKAEDKNIDSDSDVQEKKEAPTVSEEGVSTEGELLRQLSAAQERADQHKADYLRAVADLDNFRKRIIREKEELRKAVMSSVIEGLLPVVDNLTLGIDAAEKHKHDEAEGMIQGFQMVLVQLQSILREHGIGIINPSKSEGFDPNHHESVALIPNETVPEGGIIEVVRVGYLLNDRLLRPASVVVSGGKPAEETDNSEEE